MRKLIKYISLFLILIFSFNLTVFATQSLNTTDLDFKEIIEQIYKTRSNCFITEDTDYLKNIYDSSQKYGKWTLEHEVMRIKYLKSWAKERNIVFSNVDSTVRIKKVYPSTSIKKIYLEETYKFDYHYQDEETPKINSFGIGIRHTIKLINKDGVWKVYNDFYTDCFEDALHSFVATSNLSSTNLDKDLSLDTSSKLYKVKYSREKAVEYADKYCGAAWGNDNNFMYNKIYKDFNGIGGDCTNYVSQALGDKEGGNMTLGGGWHCIYHKYGKAEGSNAWVNADGLKNFLLYSGRGKLIKKGTYSELTRPTNDNANGFISKIQIGDLICYEKKGNIDHFAMVTGFDTKGYPLVNSHTTDRYHVPWDLGWGDSHIKFLLIHIND